MRTKTKCIEKEVYATGYSLEFTIVSLTHKVGVDPGVGVDSGGSESESLGNPSIPQPWTIVCLVYV